MADADPEFQLRFDFQRRSRRGFDCNRPVIDVWVDTSFGWMTHEFIFDSGSDFSLFPIQAAKGTVKHPTEEHALLRGVGFQGELIDGYFGNLACRLDGVKFDLPTLFYFPQGYIELETELKKIQAIPEKPPVKPAKPAVKPSVSTQSASKTPRQKTAQAAADSSKTWIGDWIRETELWNEERAGQLLLEMDALQEKKSLFDDPPFVLGRANFLDRFAVKMQHDITWVKRNVG